MLLKELPISTIYVLQGKEVDVLLCHTIENDMTQDFRKPSVFSVIVNNTIIISES